MLVLSGQVFSPFGEDWLAGSHGGGGISRRPGVDRTDACRRDTACYDGMSGWNVTSAAAGGWQVTLCDVIWHVSSSSGVATLVSELLYLCYFA